MTIQECYAKMGGNYDEVVGRLRTDERVQKFLMLFMKDTSFSDLKANIESGNAPEAFRAAHTLKGICGNLSLTKLLELAESLTEALRNKSTIEPEVAPLYASAKEAYDEIIQAVSGLIQ